MEEVQRNAAKKALLKRMQANAGDPQRALDSLQRDGLLDSEEKLSSRYGGDQQAPGAAVGNTAVSGRLTNKR